MSPFVVRTSGHVVRSQGTRFKEMAKIKLSGIETAGRNLRTLMSVSCLHLTYKFLPPCVLTFEFVWCGLFIYSLYYYANNIEKFINVGYTLVLSSDVITAIVAGYVYKNQFHKLVNDSYYTYDYQSSIMRRKIDEIEEERAKSLRKFFKDEVIFVCFLIVLQNGTAFLHSIVHNEVFLMFPCWLPVDTDSVHAHLLVLLCEEMINLNIHFMGFGAVAAMYTVYSHIKTELAIIRYAIKNIVPRALEMAGGQKKFREENLTPDNDRILSRCYYECTRMCAEHHCEVLEYFHNGKYPMMLMYTTAFFSGVLSCSFAGYFLISDNFALKSKLVGLSICGLALIFVMFLIADGITSQLLTVARTAYTMEWYNLPKNCQSTIRLIQLKSNEPLFYMMILGQRVDMEGYMSFLKAIYYYVNLMIAK